MAICPYCKGGVSWKVREGYHGGDHETTFYFRCPWCIERIEVIIAPGPEFVVQKATEETLKRD